jgi:hypothetical protein
MVAKEPRQSADIILSFLMGVNQAGAGAIFSVEDGMRLFVSHGIAQEMLDWTGQCWRRDYTALSQGRLARSDDRFLVPVLRGQRLAALVYLEAAQLDLSSTAEVAGLIADAVIRCSRQPASISPVESYLARTPAKEIERRKLLILLDRHEWNLARVARELDVTRTTIYKRLASFGIARERKVKDDRGARQPVVPSAVRLT